MYEVQTPMVTGFGPALVEIEPLTKFGYGIRP